MTPATDPVAAAEALAPRVAELADAIEAGRGLPADLVEQLAGAGLFQLFVRPSLGGPGADPVTACRAIEVLARADASTAWCAMVSTTSGYPTGWLALDEARAMFGSPLDVRIAGSSRPLGRALPVDGGYRVSGRWDFASGVSHANWLLASCRVDGAEPRLTFAPARYGVVDETWDTIGMRGTGSHDLVLDEVFVPDGHTAWFEDEPDESLPLYDRRLVRVATHSPAVAVALGAARGALDTFIDLARTEATTSSPRPLSDRPEVQTAVARADAAVDAARCRFYDAVGEAWHAVESGRSDTRREIARARSAMAVAASSCLDAATLLLHSAGTTGVFTRNRLERRVRDLHVIGRFSAFSAENLTGVGRVLLGLEPEGLGW